MGVVDNILENVSKYISENYEPSKKLIWFPGGDYWIFDDLNKVFLLTPPNVNVFVEVFGDSCYTSLNVSRKKFKIIVANDIDSDLINMYRVIRDSPNEMIKRLSIIPVSRELYEIAKEVLNDTKADNITKAVLLFYLYRVSMFGKGGFGISKTRQLSRELSEAITYIIETTKKFREIVFENKDYKDIIKIYDSENTLFYLDPPYPTTSEVQGREGYYGCIFTHADLQTMATILKDIKGYWVLKSTKDIYLLIKDYLPQHNIMELEKAKSFQKVINEKKPKVTFIIAYSFKINTPKQDNLRRRL